MLDHDTRTAILRMADEGHGPRVISRTLSISRNAVRGVLRHGSADVPTVVREQIADAHIDRIRELFVSCQGNVVRVFEELRRDKVEIAYSTLTSFCRRQGLGQKPKRAAGQYHFEAGQEMQHDTSPHDVTIAGRVRRVQCASLVMCYSHAIYAQVFPTWNRFWCKVFLTDALRYFGGAAGLCMLDNSTVIIAHGTGRDAVPAPEMAAFSERFGFDFVAHEKGDANRSGRVERPFDFIERNFYPGRTFADTGDLNRQFVVWCDEKNGAVRTKERIVPFELLAAERPSLKPLPAFIPEVYALHQRIVDTEGYANLHGNRYSVDETLIGHRVEVRESKDSVRVFRGHDLVATHARADDGLDLRVTLPEHRKQSRWKYSHGSPPTFPEEGPLRAAAPEFIQMIDAMRSRTAPGYFPRRLRRLHRLWIDYPIDPLRAALRTALAHGLFDVDRIERIVLRNVGRDFFRLDPPQDDDDPKESDDG
jgi:hypothetical protein